MPRRVPSIVVLSGSLHASWLFHYTLGSTHQTVSDDFYTSTLALSVSSQLAVALDNNVHLWSGRSGQKQIFGTYTNPHTREQLSRARVTAIAYSNNNKWLGIARKDGLIQVYGKVESGQPGECLVQGDIACISFRPASTSRHEKEPDDVLLVGGYRGCIHYVSVTSVASRNTRRIRCQIVRQIVSGHSEQVT